MADGHDHFLRRLARSIRPGARPRRVVRQARARLAARCRTAAGDTRTRLTRRRSWSRTTAPLRRTARDAWARLTRRPAWSRATGPGGWSRLERAGRSVAGRARGALLRVTPRSDRGGVYGLPRPPGAAVARTSRQRVARGACLALSGLVLLTAAAGAFVYLRLDGNLRDLPLFGGVGGDAGHERPDAFGRTPLNVLVIGSDTRADPADCRLGGDCGPGQNADVEMLLHLSADRSHGTVLSIPRDTVTDLPACRRPHGGIAPGRRGPVNSTLRYGPGCTVAAVHTLTGIPVDHFVMADFSGVVGLSDAVGGVPVCVDRDVYDPYSHLKLARGRHALKGEAALEFLRSRHAFGDGSDLGRTDAQHLFLASLFRQLRAGGSLTDPAGMLSLADAATKALTVDPGLASVRRLAGLADDVRKVPAARLVFTTMPTAPDPLDRNRLVPDRTADRLFAGIAADLPLHVTGTPPPDAQAAGGRAAYGTVQDSLDDRALPGVLPGTSAGTPGPSAPGRTAAGGAGCAKVSTRAAVTVRGAAMTPSAAFAATPHIPVSAP